MLFAENVFSCVTVKNGGMVRGNCSKAWKFFIEGTITVLFHEFEKFLDAFANLRKATTCFVTSVLPSVCLFFIMQQLGYHWTDLDEI